MAQPPDISDTFVKEVDENLRRDRVRDFLRENGGWIVAGVVLFLVISGGIIWYQQHRQQRAEAQVEQLAQFRPHLDNANRPPQAPRDELQLEELVDECEVAADRLTDRPEDDLTAVLHQHHHRTVALVGSCHVVGDERKRQKSPMGPLASVAAS